MLYRLLYQRAGTTRAVTFQADDLVEVADFVTLWERCAKVVVQDIKQVRVRAFVKSDTWIRDVRTGIDQAQAHREEMR